MNQSQSQSVSSQRFDAEKAFFESLEDLNDLVTESTFEQHTASSEIKLSHEDEIDFTWDQVEQDLEQILPELWNQE